MSAGHIDPATDATTPAAAQTSVPMFSIITATYNARRHLPALAASIAAQGFDDYEWIVIDGKSKDGTAEYLAGLPNPRLRWISELDRGIYDAMNKGIDRARGRYIYFIGADDAFAATDTLQRVADAIGTADADLACGLIDTGKRSLFRSSLGPRTLVMNSVHHQGAFYRRELFATFRYRTDVPVIADYELNLLAHLEGRRLLPLALTIAVCGAGGISNTSALSGLYRQMHRVRRHHMHPLRSRLFWAIGMLNAHRRRLFPRG